MEEKNTLFSRNTFYSDGGGLMLGLIQVVERHVLIVSQLSKKLKRIYAISMTVNVLSVWFLSMNHNVLRLAVRAGFNAQCEKLKGICGVITEVKVK